MARAPHAPRKNAEPILFELDSFELAGDGRLELSGRWFGVRGRRFVRPTLRLLGDGEASRRSLADLEHKPWSAQDGESWHAAFPCDPSGGDVTEVELAVAPDIAVLLPPPGALRKRRQAGVPAKRPSSAATPPGPERSTAETATRADELDALRRALELQRRETRRLQQELERAEVAKAELKSIRAGRDAARTRLEATIAERDQAVRERDQAVRERDAAALERDRAVAERGTAQQERDAALAARAALHARLEQLQASASAQISALRAEIEHERARPAPILQPQPAPIAVPIVMEPARRRRRGIDWLHRGLAIVVLLAAVIALVIVLQSA
jgi:hypothetical protein